MADEIKELVKDVSALMEEVIDDRGVPRNIRNIIEQAKDKINGKGADTMGFSSAIYLLDDISNDINMPHHTRTDIWEIISKLETIKEQVK